MGLLRRFPWKFIIGGLSISTIVSVRVDKSVAILQGFAKNDNGGIGLLSGIGHILTDVVASDVFTMVERF